LSLELTSLGKHRRTIYQSLWAYNTSNNNFRKSKFR